jgi:hypothetical protein
MNLNDEALPWRDVYRIPVMVLLIVPVTLCFVVGFVLGTFSDAFEEGIDAAIEFGE